MKAAPSHRPLPDDPAIADLDDGLRAQVAAAWRSRARNELSSSTVFASLTRSLVGFDAPRPIIREVAMAVADEVRHAEICEHVAAVYEPSGGRPPRSPVVEEPAILRGEIHDVAGAAYLVMQSCINEGVACVYLQRGVAEARFDLARAAVRDILEDEIRHARLGWSLLASGAIPLSWRTGIASALPDLFERVAEAWTRGDREAPDTPAGHGNIPTSAMPDVLRSAFEDLILPGFDFVGIETKIARAWLVARRW